MFIRFSDFVDLAVCENMPLSFARHWQVIGQKGRQLWIGRHYLRILGPVDDVFGEHVCYLFL